MRKIMLLIPVVFLCLSVCVEAQPLTWEKIYGYSNDVAHGVAKSNDSTFYVCGNAGFSIVLKLNQFGDTLWTKRFIDSTVNFTYTIVSTEDGGCIISGYWDGLFALKLNTSGGVVWKKIYKIPGVQTSKLIRNGKFYYGCANVSNVGFLFKIDDFGNLIWTKYLNNFSSVKLNDLCFDSQTNSLMIAGQVVDNNSVFGYLAKVSTDSNIQFQKKYRVLNKATTTNHILKFKNDFFITGATIDSNDTYVAPYLQRIKSNADTIFTNVFPISRDEEIGSFFIKIDTKLIFSSNIYSNLIGDTLKVKLFTTDTLGNILNSKYIVRQQGCETRDALLLNSGYFVFAGLIKRGTTDIWILITDSLFDFVPVGIKNENEFINNFTLNQNYPNPFNPSTKISYSLKKSSAIELKLIDINGRLIKIIESGFKPAGSYEINFSAEGLSSGVYFFSLYSEGILMDTKKAVVMK